ncbi:MAG: chitobiase/beta-hexosaminidase C-terminal domain-containing protein [Bacteroidetes bacterium]|nr:chitobiase/beta-hexosaminidase C-terminal domain-containing protein [Bacteroidota bacterium]MCB0844131.1 chitobiase/beta-hexosaminidase C-terminal domain-containing protein [Bacteroidota bacterium]
MKLYANAYYALLLWIIGFTPSFSQSPLNHPPTIYQDSSALIHVKASSPVFLFLSTSPEGDGIQPLHSGSSPMIFKQEGKHVLTHSDTNQKTQSNITIQADGTAPESNYIFSREAEYMADTYRYFNEKVEITFHSKDNLAGISDIYYSIDNKDFKKYDSPISLKKEKNYQVSYYAVDRVGNVEKPREITFEIDLTSPKSTHLITGHQINDIFSPGSEITLSSQDEGAGVEKIYWTIDNGVPQIYEGPVGLDKLPEGDHKIKYYGVDAVGNQENPHTISFFLDKSAPRIADDVLGDQYFTNGSLFISPRTTLKLTVVDNKAGVEQIKYKINQEEYRDYLEPITFADRSGNVQITSYAVDKVANSNQDKSPVQGEGKRNLIIDSTNPTISYGFEGHQFEVSDTMYISTETSIFISAKDEESGLKSLRYTLNTEKENVYKTPFQLKEEKIYQVIINSEDQVANRSQETFYCRVDATGPVIYPRFSIDPIKSLQADDQTMDIYSPQVMLFLAATDQLVGYDQMYYSINGSEEKRYGEVLRDFESGKDYEIMIRAIDKLGNETKETIRFSVKK